MFHYLKPYESVAPTGTAWLGDAPGHWRVMPGAGVLRLVRERNKDLREDVVLSLSYGRVVVKPVEKLHGLVPVSFETYQVLEPGAIVVRPTDLQNDQTSVRVGLVRDRGIITSAYLGFGVSAVAIPEFAYSYLAALDAKKVFYGMGSGLRQNLEWADFRRLPLLVPPLDEQAAIVKYLGHAHARIDRAIAAKRKLIALLEEQKQAIINQAVTRGLDPTATMKDSGIPSLGEVPAHWRLPMLGQCIERIEQGWSPAPAEGALGDDQWAVLSLSAVNRGAFDRSAIKPVASSSLDVLTRLQVRDGDLLLTRSNTRSRVGDAAIVVMPRPRTIFSDLIYRVTTRHKMARAEYVAVVLRSYVGRGQIERDARGSSGTMPKIAHGHIRSWRMPLPPSDEQDAILKHLELEGAPVDAAIGHACSEIELLREFRTRLTSDVVTGQVDVRANASSLPDFVEPGSIDADSDEDESLEDLDDVLEGADA